MKTEQTLKIRSILLKWVLRMDSLGEIKELRKTYGFKGVVCEELEEYLDSLETSNKND